MDSNNILVGDVCMTYKIHRSATTFKPQRDQMNGTKNGKCNELVGNLASWQSCGQSLTHKTRPNIMLFYYKVNPQTKFAWSTWVFGQMVYVK